MSISACMIVKNEEEMLKRTLLVLKQGVDEIILVDTGSTDNTIKVAEENSAKIFHFKWIDNFSAARNESLKRAKSDWIIWIDADEMIKIEDWANLKEFLKTAKEDAYSLEIRECKPGTYNYDDTYSRVKVLRNNKGIHFERAFNEQLYSTEGKAVSGEVIPNVAIYHWGARLTKDAKELKKERNIRILQAQVESNPNDPYFHFFLASNYNEIGKTEEAVSEFRKTIDLTPSENILISAYTSIAFGLYKLKRAKEAFNMAKAAMAIDPNEAGAYCLIGLILGGAGSYKEAIDILEYASKIDPTKARSASQNLRNTKYLPFYYEGIVYQMAQDKVKAKEAFKKAYEFEKSEEVVQKLEELKNVA
ncbi:glycosyltransferase [Candidatus Saganbacteria bacterium]|nr:glycosyltransferase [Candidatus Saganbacteria bacterium]